MAGTIRNRCAPRCRARVIVSCSRTNVGQNHGNGAWMQTRSGVRTNFSTPERKRSNGALSHVGSFHVGEVRDRNRLRLVNVQRRLFGFGSRNIKCCASADSESAVNPVESSGAPEVSVDGGDDDGRGGSDQYNNGGGGNNGDHNDGSSGDRREDPDQNDTLLGLSDLDLIRDGQKVPELFMQAAAAGALRKSSLTSFLDLQARLGSFAWILHRFGFIRDRLIYDDRFLFKMGAEVLIDSGCATFAEVKKRAEEFWNEIEFYVSDLVVGCVLDCVLVTLLAPVSPVWGGPKAARLLDGDGIQQQAMRILKSLPSAAAARGTFTMQQRAAAFAITGAQYAVAGFVAGVLGQALANAAIVTRRRLLGQSLNPEDVKTQPIVQTAIVWTLFMGLSSNTRYQTVYLIERVVSQE